MFGNCFENSFKKQFFTIVLVCLHVVTVLTIVMFSTFFRTKGKKFHRTKVCLKTSNLLNLFPFCFVPEKRKIF